MELKTVSFCFSSEFMSIAKPQWPHGPKMKTFSSFLGGQQPLVPFLLLGPPFLLIILLLSTTLLNGDDRQLLAHAIACR
jgi:hypothetical protein